MTPTLRVATLNLLNDTSRWDERLPLIVAGCRSVAADLIALQEVTDPLGFSSAHRLAAALGDYSVVVAPKVGRAGRREGIATLSRFPIIGHEVLDLGGQGRVAQFVRFRLGDRPVVVGNGHYDWNPLGHAARVRQVDRTLGHLHGLDPGVALILAGDFNGLPGSPAVRRIRRTMASAHEVYHGHEPDFTCPTPLTSRHRLRGGITRALLRLGTNRPGQSWRGTLDYIFVAPDIRVLDARVFLDRPAPLDPTLYASDHLGLVATLAISAAGSG